MDFQLRSVPLLSRIGADRADQVRTDVEAATAGWSEAVLLRLDSRNQVLVVDGRERSLGPGTAAVVPPNMRHAVRTVGACRVIVTDYPVRHQLPGVRDA